MPGLQALDARAAGTVEMCQTPTYFYIGKEPTLRASPPACRSASTRAISNAWWSFGGGAELINESLRQVQRVRHPVRQSGTQMGGWFRKEIKTVDDLRA